MLELWFAPSYNSKLHIHGHRGTALCGSPLGWTWDHAREIPHSWMEDPGAHNICKRCANMYLAAQEVTP